MRSKKLTQAFDDFTDKMKKRLNKKEREGFTGWAEWLRYDCRSPRKPARDNGVVCDFTQIYT